MKKNETNDLEKFELNSLTNSEQQEIRGGQDSIVLVDVVL